LNVVWYWKDECSEPGLANISLTFIYGWPSFLDFPTRDFQALEHDCSLNLGWCTVNICQSRTRSWMAVDLVGGGWGDTLKLPLYRQKAPGRKELICHGHHLFMCTQSPPWDVGSK
jgi:hypothetical protein